MTTQVRRVVTGVNGEGKAVVIQDGLAPATVSRPALAMEGALIWTTSETPADLSQFDDPTFRPSSIGPTASGTLVRVTDFHPQPKGVDDATVQKEFGLGGDAQGGRHALMHKTRTLDYAIVLDGEIDMLLDEGEVHLKAGDILIQRGTNHAWVNRGDKPCRIAFVMVDAQDYPPAEGRAFPQQP
jgi:mannose-6-phosphate isomerase-like protein (cupin superfamily)